MSRVLIAAVVFLAAPALAQADGGTAAPTDAEALRREVDTRLEAARKEVKELREEMRAQLATQSVAQGWQEDWVEEKRKLELVTFDGYLRVRPELFNKFDMGRGRDHDPNGYPLWGRSPLSDYERTNAGVNMRFRFEPTINISEEVRIRAQIDALDNAVWGSNSDYAYSRNGPNNYFYDRNEFSLFSNSQVAPASGINSFGDSIAVRRIWGEVSTPVGIFRFGRMGSHWGLGMLHNDGNGLDSDWGDTVDRLMFVAEPINGFYVTPMLDFNVEGLLSPKQSGGGQQYDLSNSDDSHSYILAIARRDTESEARAKLDSGRTVFNYGVHFTYRTQKNDDIDTFAQPFTTDGTFAGQVPGGYVKREGQLFMPDLWVKLERKEWRLELEAAGIFGNLKNRALASSEAGVAGKNQELGIVQFGAVLQGEYRLLHGDLELGGEIGIASGDKAPGFGNYPRRPGSGAEGTTAPGDTDGPQYQCFSTGTCTDNSIRNFRFNRDYRIDSILYREILGGITDSFYIKPKASYRVTQGINVFASLIYSRAIYAESTPSAHVVNGNIVADANLGVELDVGGRYETEDGFFAQLSYGVFFPMAGFSKIDPSSSSGANVSLDTPMALRALFGIKF